MAAVFLKMRLSNQKAITYFLKRMRQLTIYQCLHNSNILYIGTLIKNVIEYILLRLSTYTAMFNIAWLYWTVFELYCVVFFPIKHGQKAYIYICVCVNKKVWMV